MNHALSLLNISTNQIDPHPWNRKEFDRALLDELKADVKDNGIETPLSLREKPDGRFEIIKGERRWTVATELELPEVPAFVATKDDLGAYLSLLRDNLQREQLSPVQEAAGYHRLMSLQDAQGEAFTPEKISKTLNRSVDVVYRRLKLVNLPAKAREALDEGRIAEETAFLLGRLPTAEMREECAKAVLNPRWGEPGRVLNVKDTRELIAEDFMVTLKGCPWDKDDAELVPTVEKSGARLMGGACSDCPHLARNNPTFTGELAEGKQGGKGGKTAGVDPLTCLNPACFRLKMEAHAKRKIATAATEGREVLNPKEAQKIFSRGGSLAHDCKLERLSDKPDYNETGHWNNDKNPTWGEIIKLAEKQDIQVPVKVTINPETKELEELVDRKTMIEVARKVKPQLFKRGGERSKPSAAETAARKTQLEKDKIKKAMVNVGMTYLRAQITAKPIGAEGWLEILGIALEHSGYDGMRLFKAWLAVPEDKKAASGSRESAAMGPILKHVKDESTEQLQALAIVALVMRDMRWQQTDCEAFKKLAKHFGVDLKDVEAAAKQSLKKPEKGSKGKGKEPLVTTTRSKSAKRNQAAIIASESTQAKPEPIGVEKDGNEVADDDPKWLAKKLAAKKAKQRAGKKPKAGKPKKAKAAA